MFPWALQTLMRGETLTLSTLAALPPEAARDRENIQRYGTKSVVAIPLVAEGTVFGALTLRGDARGTGVAGRRREGLPHGRRSDRQCARPAARGSGAPGEPGAPDPGGGQRRRAPVGGGGRDGTRVDDGRGAGVLRPRPGGGDDASSAWSRSSTPTIARRGATTSGRRWTPASPCAASSASSARTAASAGFVSQGRPHGDATGKPRRLLGVSIDVTERRQVEERLRTSEALSSGVLASLPGHMVIVDRSGVILRTSDTWPAFAAGDGALDPTVLAVGAGRPHAQPRAAEHAGPLIKEIQGGIEAVLTGAQADFRLEYAYPTRTEERWASVSVLPLQRPEGGAVIYLQDITLQQRSRLEAETPPSRPDPRRPGDHDGGDGGGAGPRAEPAADRHLEQRPRGRAVPGAGAPPLDEIREILQDVVGDARRAGDVIQRLRSLLRKEEARFLPLDVNQVIREMAALVHTDAILRNVCDRPGSRARASPGPR